MRCRTDGCTNLPHLPCCKPINAQVVDASFAGDYTFRLNATYLPAGVFATSQVTVRVVNAASPPAPGLVATQPGVRGCVRGTACGIQHSWLGFPPSTHLRMTTTIHRVMDGSTVSATAVQGWAAHEGMPIPVFEGDVGGAAIPDTASMPVLLGSFVWQVSRSLLPGRYVLVTAVEATAASAAGVAAVQFRVVGAAWDLVDRYVFETLPWGPCSATCGSGTQSRKLVCVDSAASANSNIVVATELCATVPTAMVPATQRECFGSACPGSVTAVWRAGAWGTCSASCGRGGQVSVVGGGLAHMCWSSRVDVVRALTPVRVGYVMQPPCGLQTRVVSCVDTASGLTTNTNRCALQPLPDAWQPCFTRACPDQQWRYSEWRQCALDAQDAADECQGVQHRSAVCVDSSGSVLWASSGSDEQQNQPSCGGVPLAALQRPCFASAGTGGQGCTNAVAYRAGQWEGCSRTCGGGVATRTVECYSVSTGISVPLSVCESLQLAQPPASRTCNAQACTVTLLSPGAWSVCSHAFAADPGAGQSVAAGTCGGVQNRDVTCMASDSTLLANQRCSASVEAQQLLGLPLTRQCEMEDDECQFCDHNNTCSGHGTCAGESCDCNNGFDGMYCETSAEVRQLAKQSGEGVSACNWAGTDPHN